MGRMTRSMLEQPEEGLKTVEELLQIAHLGRMELVKGRIVQTAPTGGEHGKYELTIGGILKRFVKNHGLGEVLSGEVGIIVARNPDTVRGADVCFISRERYGRLSNPAAYLDVTPELVVEVLSPNDSWINVTGKLREYFAAGVQLVWVADPETRIVHAYRSVTDVREFQQDRDLPGDDVLPGFSVRVAELFD